MDKATIASLSQAEWESLDLWKWLIAHYKPYTGAIAQTMKRRFGCYEPNEVENLIYVNVYPALVSIHRSHLNAKGEERNQILFRTILITAQKRIPWLLGIIYPHNEIRGFDCVFMNIETAREDDQVGDLSQEWPEWGVLDNIMYPAASSDCATYDTTADAASTDPEQMSDDEDTRMSQYVERLRPIMPQRWHQVLRMGACDRLGPKEIAEKLGVGLDHIYSIRSRTKRLLSDFLHRNKVTCA